MVVGGLMGRMVGHLMQWLVLLAPNWAIFGKCASATDGTYIQPGVYGLMATGATMCGVTRLSVTLAVILFELTGSLDYVLPFSVAMLVSKWTADAIESNSLYVEPSPPLSARARRMELTMAQDLLTNMNSYPFLNNQHKPVFTNDLADIVPRPRRARAIDITSSPLVPARSLRAKLEMLHRAGELDGGLPIVRNEVLVGLIPAPDLEYALDQLEDEQTSMFLMDRVPSIEEDGDDEADPTDFTRYIDPAPVALDIRSPMDLVYECFVKLGLQYICVLKDGRYAGMTHKKTLVKYLRAGVGESWMRRRVAHRRERRQRHDGWLNMLRGYHNAALCFGSLHGFGHFAFVGLIVGTVAWVGAGDVVRLVYGST